MNACVLIPHKLSLVLQIPSHSDNNFNVNGEVWANTLLVPGAVFKPDEGELRLDRLDNCHVLDDNDVNIPLPFYCNNSLPSYVKRIAVLDIELRSTRH